MIDFHPFYNNKIQIQTIQHFKVSEKTYWPGIGLNCSKLKISCVIVGLKYRYRESKITLRNKILYFSISEEEVHQLSYYTEFLDSLERAYEKIL